MRIRRIAVGLSAAAFSLGALTACSSSDSEPAATPAATSVAGSATDIAFAQSMIPHHEQAVEMADLALAPESGASPQVQELARQIKAAQDPEIQQMTGWLTAWGAPTAMPGGTTDHSGHDMGGMTMSGMMTEEQMSDLMQASGSQFDEMWLEMMIEHHEGAIAMAEQVQSSSDPQVTAMAEAIITGQQGEISTMQGLLSQ